MSLIPSLSSIKRTLIRGITDEDIKLSIEKIDELAQKYDLILEVQMESGKIKTIKILSFSFVKYS